MFTGTVFRGPGARAFNKFAVGDVLLFLVSDTESLRHACLLVLPVGGAAPMHGQRSSGILAQDSDRGQ